MASAVGTSSMTEVANEIVGSISPQQARPSGLESSKGAEHCEGENTIEGRVWA